MSKWGTFTGVNINPQDLDEAIAEMLQGYGDIVYKATEEGLSAGEGILIRNLKAASPKRSGKFAKAWKGKGKRYKLRRYVGNTTTVKGKSGDIALANILEYSTTRGKPFIKTTYENSINEIAEVIVNEIKKEA